MKKTIIILTILLVLVKMSAQERAVTMKGDTINVYENGTWEKINKVKKITEIESNVKATVEIDEFSKAKKIRTENWTKFGKNPFGGTINGSLAKVDDFTVFIISYSGNLGCLSEYDSTMKVKLTNGEIIEFSQISDTDCGDNPSARFIPLTREQLKDPDLKDLLKDNLEILRQFDWETIRVQGTEYYTDISPNVSRKMENPEQFFRQHLIAVDKK